MAYARFIDNDVYVFLHVGGFFDCCGCSLGKHEGFYSTKEILNHLEEHIKQGDRVQDECLSDLMADQEENDQWIRDHEENEERFTRD